MNSQAATHAIVMPGLDPGIHHAKKMDCRVKPGNDNRGNCVESEMDAT
jgi:hypothetical protein